MCEKTLPPKEMDMTKSHVHFFCQVASIRIFFFDRFGQYHSQERVTVQSFKKFLAKKRINALACSKILSNTST